ncbi:enterobactin biosynthesis bifunctional isochorismatase/aryl carrier protein EntB [soil metagenome]
MPLPELIDYVAPVPPATALPTNRAEWTLEPGRAALLVHDLQRYFLRPYAPDCPALISALTATARLLVAARAAGVPVIYTAQDGDHSDRGLQRDLWGPGMSTRSEHTEILPEVAPQPRDTILTKLRYSAFAKSDLDRVLAEHHRDHLVITGVYAHIGVTATALDAFQREVHPWVVADAVADFGRDEHVRALEQVAACCGAVILADDVVAVFGSTIVETGWDGHIRTALAEVLDEEIVAQAFAEPTADLFELGLNSLQAFEVLDLMAEAGIDIDFGVFTREASIAFLRSQGASLAIGR